MSDINTFPGFSGAEVMSKHIRDLEARIYRIENEDSLSRVHPVTGSTDFVGTVLRTPNGQPVFVASEDGLEAPATPGFGRVFDDVGGISIDSSLLANQEGPFNDQFVSLMSASFAGVVTTLFQIPVAASVFAEHPDGNGSEWQLKFRLQGSFTTDGVTTVVTSHEGFVDSTTTAFVDQGVVLNLNPSRAINGVLRWEHGQSINEDTAVIVEVQYQIDSLSSNQFTALEDINLDIALPVQRGANMVTGFDNSVLYTETNIVV